MLCTVLSANLPLFLSPASLLLYFLLEPPLSLYRPVLICMTEFTPVPPPHPSVLTYLQRYPPHPPDGVEGQRREHNWDNPLFVLLCFQYLLTGHRHLLSPARPCIMQHFPTRYPMTALLKGQEGHRSAASLPIHPAFTNKLGASYPEVDIATRTRLFQVYDNGLKLSCGTRTRSNKAAHRFAFPRVISSIQVQLCHLSNCAPFASLLEQ